MNKSFDKTGFTGRPMKSSLSQLPVGSTVNVGGVEGKVEGYKEAAYGTLSLSVGRTGPGSKPYVKKIDDREIRAKGFSIVNASPSVVIEENLRNGRRIISKVKKREDGTYDVSFDNGQVRKTECSLTEVFYLLNLFLQHTQQAVSREELSAIFTEEVVDEFFSDKDKFIDFILANKLVCPSTEETLKFFENTAIIQQLGKEEFKIYHENDVDEGNYLIQDGVTMFKILYENDAYKQGLWGLYKIDKNVGTFLEKGYLSIIELLVLFDINAISLNNLLTGNLERIEKLFGPENKQVNFKENLLKVRRDTSKVVDLLGYLDPAYGEISYPDEQEMEALGLFAK